MGTKLFKTIIPYFKLNTELSLIPDCFGRFVDMVEAARIELASRESSIENTTSVVYVYFLHYLIPIDWF